MKKIIEQSSKGLPSVNPFEVVKLRLRGKGSGFKEGPLQLESTDPLNLCVSSRYLDRFQTACSLIESLLRKIYDEFQQFYRRKLKKPQLYGHKLEIKKEESITRPKS